MKKKINVLIISFLTSVLFSCETIIDDIPLSRFPDLNEKLVLYSFLCPQDTMIYVSLGKSVPLFGSGQIDTTKVVISNGDSVNFVRINNYVPDATVTLTDGTKTSVLKFNTKIKFYEISRREFRLESGKTYTLTAKSGKMEVSATTKIPLVRVRINNLQIRPFTQITSSFFEKDTNVGFQLKFSWEDVFGEDSYYKIFGEMEYKQMEPLIKYTNNKEEVSFFEKTKYSYFRWPNEQNSGLRNYFTDKNADGNQFRIDAVNLFENKSSYSTSSGKYKSESIPDSEKVIRVQLSNISKEFYDYHKSLSENNRTDDNPFAEPIQVYTNVKNGFGCVAGYNRTETVVRTK
jgi:Domain of unknown function (DUF4249)